MNKISRILALREGGQTQRCHTMPHFGEYSVASHSYNATLLLLELHTKKPPSLNLIKAVLYHDVPERWTGDTPAPAKWASPILKAVLDGLELKIFEKLGIAKIFQELTEEEKMWLAAVDLLELYIWGEEQTILGNRVVADLNKRVKKLFEEKGNKFPKEVQDFVKNFEWSRSMELNEL